MFIKKPIVRFVALCIFGLLQTALSYAQESFDLSETIKPLDLSIIFIEIPF